MSCGPNKGTKKAYFEVPVHEEIMVAARVVLLLLLLLWRELVVVPVPQPNIN